MPVELLHETVFDFSRIGWENSLANPEKRRYFRPNQNNSTDRLNLVKEKLDLVLYEERLVGQKRILRIFHGSQHLENFGRESKTFVKIGLAEECKRDSDCQDKLKTVSTVARVSKGFYAEDFADGAQELFAYNRRLLKIPSPLRDRTELLGLFGGSAFGLAAGIYLTGDHISGGMFGLTAGSTGLAGGSYLENLEQWDLRRRVAYLDEYFGNERGLERLEDILSHIKTVKFVNEICSALKILGVKISPEEVKILWRANPNLGELIATYNSHLEMENGGLNRVRANLLGNMLEEFKKNQEK